MALGVVHFEETGEQRTVKHVCERCQRSRSQGVTVADPRPARRIRDPRLLRNFAARASCCAVCREGRHAGRLDPHHVLPRSQRGDDVTANLVALCRPCHDDVEHYRNNARYLLGRHISLRRLDVLDYLAEKLGRVAARDYLERQYGCYEALA